jgi:hypothetical protein
MVTITKSSKVVSALLAATPFVLNADTYAQLFYSSGDARATDFSRQFIKSNAQVLLDCDSTQKWYMRYTTADTPTSEVLFLAITPKNKISKGKIKTVTSRGLGDNDQEDNIEEYDAVTEEAIA